MKNSKLVKTILIIMISLSIILVARQALAATDLTDTLTNNTTENNTITLTGNNTTNNTTNTVTINNTTENNTTLLTTTNTTNNTSNNTSLPETGIGNSVPTVILVVVLGISAVYAYRKMQDYRNI